MSNEDNAEREIKEDDNEGIKKCRPVEEQYATTFMQEVFHVTKPSTTNLNYSDIFENTTCKPLHANSCDTVTTIKCKPPSALQTEIVAPLTVQAVSTSSNGKWSGYRNKQSLIPVNSLTAILLPRPKISVTSMSGPQMQRIPVLNNTPFQLPWHVPAVIRCSSPPVNNKVSDNKVRQINHSSSNNNITDGGNNKNSRLMSQSSDTVFGSSFNLCRNNNSRVRNTTDNDARQDKNEKPVDDKQTVEDFGFRGNTNIGTRNVKNKEHIQKQANMVKHKVTETDSPTRLLDSDARNKSRVEQYKTDKIENVISDETVHEVDSLINVPSTSKYVIREHPRQAVGKEQQQYASVNLYIKNDNISGQRSMSETEELNTRKVIANTSISNVKSISIKENELSSADNTTDTINRVASGEGTLTFSSNSCKKKSHRAGIKANQDDKHNAGTTKSSAEDAVTEKSFLKKQQRKELSVKLFQSKQPSKKNSKAFLDIEARYIGHQVTGVNSFEDVFGKESDLINKIESDKLSKVKDHHLLKLSDKEREYLKNKCYLEDDLTVDVRRRFEQQTGASNEACTSKLSYDTENCRVFINVALEKRNEPHLREDGPKAERREEETSDVNFEASTTSFSDSNYERRHDKSMLIEKQVEQEGKKNSRKEQSNDHSESEVKLRQPVVKRKRFECHANEEIEKQNSTPMKTQTANNQSNARKVYYVINSNDIVRLHHQSLGTKPENDIVRQHKTLETKPANDIAYKISASMAKPLPATTNSTLQSAITAKSTFYHNPAIDAKVSIASNCTDLNLKSISRRLMHESHLNKNCDSLLNLTKNGEFHVKSSQACENLSLLSGSNLQYSNKFTVKELLQAKRGNESWCSTINRQTKLTKSIPTQLYGRAINGTQLKASFVTQSKIKETNVKLELSTAATNSPRNLKPENTVITLPPKISHSNMSTQPGNLLNIVNPSVILPASTVRHPYTSPGSDTTVFPTATKLHTVTATQVSSVFKRGTIGLQSGTEKREPVYIKIGGKTMVVKRCDSRNNAGRKTLPAPKPRHSIADDYKRKRRQSKIKNTHRVNEKSLRVKLKKLLEESDESVQNLMNTLDLVPVELLKNFISTKEEPTERELDTSNTAKETLVSSNQNKIVITKPTKLHTEKDNIDTCTKSRKRKLTSNNPANMANIMQISKRKDGDVGYGIHQVKVRYAKAKLVECRNLGFLCRLKFSVEGQLKKVYTESLRQGLYLVQNCKGEIAHLKRNRKMDVFLVLYPPHVATIPEGSLCIAVGDMYSEQQRNQYKFKPGSSDVQKVLEQFLWPFSMENIDNFIDKRYRSVTDRSMSPRCSSPMFYSPNMKDAFDLDGSSGSCYDISKEDLPVSASMSKRFETVAIKSTRFSERAMALKIKQNELFETCRRLKSERTVKEGNKKKKESAVQTDTAKNGTAQNDFIGGVRILIPEIPEQDIFTDELVYCSTSNSQAYNEVDDSVSDINVD